MNIESFKYFTSAWWLDSVTFRLRRDYHFCSITPHKRSSSVHNHFHYLNVTSTSIKLHTAEWTHNIFKSSKIALSCGNGPTAFLLTLNYNDSAVKIHLKHFCSIPNWVLWNVKTSIHRGHNWEKPTLEKVYRSLRFKKNKQWKQSSSEIKRVAENLLDFPTLHHQLINSKSELTAVRVNSQQAIHTVPEHV